jgi:hypothetical protein
MNVSPQTTRDILMWFDASRVMSFTGASEEQFGRCGETDIAGIRHEGCAFEKIDLPDMPDRPGSGQTNLAQSMDPA